MGPHRSSRMAGISATGRSWRLQRSAASSQSRRFVVGTGTPDGIIGAAELVALKAFDYGINSNLPVVARLSIAVCALAASVSEYSAADAITNLPS